MRYVVSTEFFHSVESHVLLLRFMAAYSFLLFSKEIIDFKKLNTSNVGESGMIRSAQTRFVHK